MPVFNHPHPKITEATFNFPEFVAACKKSAYSICSFLRYSQVWRPVTKLATSIFAHPKLLWGHLLMEWGNAKNKQKQTGGRGSSLFVHSLCEKNCLIFQTANRVLSDKLLGQLLFFSWPASNFLENFYSCLSLF